MGRQFFVTTRPEAAGGSGRVNGGAQMVAGRALTPCVSEVDSRSLRFKNARRVQGRLSVR